MRPTRQRTAVAAALAALDGFTSAQSLHEALRARGESVGLTTVYRHLQALADAGEVDALRTDDGETVYRRCAGEDHHHHLVCRRCGATEEVSGPEVEAWASAVAAQHGYTDVSHTLEVFGTCRACS
jgi:Fur family ferric uptake transcriptional regulator